MRKTHLFLVLAVFSAVLLFLPACSDDDDPVATTTTEDPPTFDMTTVSTYEAPAEMLASNDPMAQQVVDYLERMEWITTRIGRLVPPPADKSEVIAKAGPWVYTWKEGEPGYDELTYTLTIREETDRYTWALRSTGFRYEVEYVNYLHLAAHIAKNGSFGWLEDYDDFGSGDLQFRWAWVIEGTALTMTIDVHDAFTPYRIVAVLNLDGSGALNYYKGEPDEGWLQFEVTWDASGAGAWTEYDEAGGVVDSGEWGE